MTPETNRFIYLIMWIILVVCDILLGKSDIDAYFDVDKIENKKKCVKQLFEVVTSVIAGSAFFVTMILKSFYGSGVIKYV